MNVKPCRHRPLTKRCKLNVQTEFRYRLTAYGKKKAQSRPTYTYLRHNVCLMTQETLRIRYYHITTLWFFVCARIDGERQCENIKVNGTMENKTSILSCLRQAILKLQPQRESIKKSGILFIPKKSTRTNKNSLLSIFTLVPFYLVHIICLYSRRIVFILVEKSRWINV